MKAVVPGECSAIRKSVPFCLGSRQIAISGQSVPVLMVCKILRSSQACCPSLVDITIGLSKALGCSSHDLRYKCGF